MTSPLDALRAATARGLRRLAMKVRGSVTPEHPHLAILTTTSFLRYSVGQAAGVAASGLPVTLVIVDHLALFTHAERDALLASARGAGVHVIAIPRRDLRRVFGHTRSLLNQLRRRHVTAILAHAHYDPRFLLASLRYPSALFIHDPQVHSGDHESTLPLRAALIARLAECTASALLLHSPRLRRQLRPSLLHVPLGDVPHGARSDLPLATPPHRPSLLLVGRLYGYKGVDVAVEAFEEVRRSRPDCVLVVAGRGPCGEALAADPRPGIIVTSRHQSDQELDELYRNATLVLLPYRDATQSGVGLDAIAHGVPCVVSNVGALPELMGDLAPDCVIPPRDPEALSSAILSMLDHDVAFRRVVQRRAHERFSWPVVGRRLLDELTRLHVLATPE